MLIQWDKDKDAANIKKHRISFEEASEVFDDPLHISVLDKRFDYLEERWITIGASKKGTIIVVGHLYSLSSGEESIRIITARKATKKERVQYEKVT
jgi:uncharacterized DUF497 family protein